MATEKPLQAAIVAYLRSRTSLAQDPDSVAIGIQCICEAFNLSDADIDAVPLNSLVDTYIGSNSSAPMLAARDEVEDLPTFKKFCESVESKGYFDGCEPGSEEYLKRHVKLVQKFKSRAGTPPSATAPAPTPVAQNDDAEGERLKAKGNEALQAARYADAAKLYGLAIDVAPTGKNVHVYYTNRAVARTNLKEYAGAVEDAKKATVIDPSYGKAWQRLGAALALQSKHSEAASAYEKACDLDPSNALAKEGLAKALKGDDGSRPGAMATNAGVGMPGGLGGLAGAMGGMGGMAGLASMLGGAGGPGGFDLAAMMRNPEMMRMAQQAVQNPQMMAAAAQMIGGMGNGGMGGLAQVMQNPQMMAAAAQMMGGMGGGAAPTDAKYDDMPRLEGEDEQ